MTAEDENDKELSEKIIDVAEAAEKWQVLAPYAEKVASFVEEYGEIIDGIGTAFAVVGVVWGIYSKMEKAKEDAAQRAAMVEKITKAVNGMIKRSTAEVQASIREESVGTTLALVQTVQVGFSRDVVPYFKEYPVSGWDTGLVDLYLFNARQAIEELHLLIEKHAKIGDGGTLLVLYRNLNSILQCKFTIDKWRRGDDPEVINQASIEAERLFQAAITVNNGMRLMSDLSFSPGLVYWQVGGGNRPSLAHYKYYYKGQIGPTINKDPKIVSRAYIEHRAAARSTVVPSDVNVWIRQAVELRGELYDRKNGRWLNKVDVVASV
ncbi:uncharacterized protein BDR25DRAFT_321659 [Lindgomyces ingoldianus]|uniref:Uncharacterized protein n=1 Tax=Lindgomyces ingoldianus TaxID=673940 RepID=A0ACB6RD37_9PLEO|nr:uncharacterized protein BDR25DRAFT_321659 [Lindgomyces ingoldianus]KAF2477244.1 hypothetical protein BDR25DRAFT_321659 [Lindgomyces ingoldianus]